MKNIKIRIFGDVQGVNFRREASAEAIEIRLKGFVSNQPDDSVYIEAEGKEEDIERLLKWCYIGPDDAKVIKVEQEISDEIQGYTDFSIR